MANYYGQTRSNYFQVKSAVKFKAFCKRYDLEVIDQKSEKDPDITRYGFMVDGSIPSGYDNKRGDWIETDFLKELSQHLVKGEVAVVMEVGSEKMRYLVGYACAVNAKGEHIEVSLNDIYRKATEAFGVEPSRAEY